MTLMRVTAQWGGFQGGPGYSNFYFYGEGGDELHQAHRVLVAEFFQGFSSYLPSGVTIGILSEGAVIDEATGMLVDYLQGTEPITGAIGSSSGSYSAAAGAVVNWNTNAVVAGRRVRGRTFIVPVGNSGLQSDGTLSEAFISTLRGAATDLIGPGSNSGLSVWSRPRAGAAGSSAIVTSAVVPDMTAVLRSRRD